MKPRTYYIIKHNFLVWVRQFVEIFDALASIFTLTLWQPRYAWAFFSWQLTQELKHQKNAYPTSTTDHLNTIKL